MIKLSSFGLPFSNIILSGLYHLDLYIYHATVDISRHPAPVGYFTVIFIFLFYGGYILLSAYWGYKNVISSKYTTKEIIGSSLVIIVSVFIILSFRYQKSLILIPILEQTAGFFLGSVAAYGVNKRKMIHKD